MASWTDLTGADGKIHSLLFMSLLAPTLDITYFVPGLVPSIAPEGGDYSLYVIYHEALAMVGPDNPLGGFAC